MKFFSSVRLAIILLIVLAAASVVGTLIPQDRTPEEYSARYGQLAGLFQGLQLTRLYHSAWFLALLGVFALNIIVCTLTRLTPKARRAARPRVAAEPRVLLTHQIKDRFKKNGALAEVRADVGAALSAAGYRVRESTRESLSSILGRKRIGGIFGSDVVHLGLLVILIGGIVSGLSVHRESLTLNEGETKSVAGRAFDVRLDKFVTEYYPGGNVKSWKSTLTVLASGAPVLTRVVEVNHPLGYKGFWLYQTGYGWNWDATTLEVWVKKKNDPEYLKKIKIVVGEKTLLEGGEPTSIEVKRFLPDFVLGENNHPETRSLQPDNPAALIEGTAGGETVFSGWIFAKFPDFAQMHGAGRGAPDLAFELKGYEAAQYSVIEAARDPGVPFIWIGSGLMMLGLILAFYWPTWEIRATLEESQGKVEVTAGGIAAKGREGLAAEFDKIMTGLRRSR